MTQIAAQGVSQTSGALSGYKTHGPGNAPQTGGDRGEVQYASLDKLKRQYLSYLWSKREEIEEQQDARRFRHASQWTAEQISQLNKRKQPIITINKIGRKINGIVGTMGRLKQDPKAYPRTPKQDQGADLATAVLKYVLDEQQWDAKDQFVTECGAVDGIGGIELNLIEGDKGDRDIGLEPIQPDAFFYDPRSYKADFSDARYLGIGKWLDIEQAKELFPDKAEEIESSYDSGTELSSNPDREFRWFMTDGEIRQIRFVDHWYLSNGKWLWAIYTGAFKIDEGESFLVDEKGKTECKYIAYSAYIDQDGDRYGFVRDLKPIQSEINMRRSKALYTMLSRRIKAEKGAVDNVEETRREAARTDGVVLYNKGFELEFDDTARMAETEAQFKFLEDAKNDMEAFGPNIAVMGEGLGKASGRAINLLQQAGLADLGPFIMSVRSFKIRMYRAIWNAVQKNWTGERWVRVTDDEDLTQYIQINGMGIDPNTGMPALVNAVGQLDVDIILDEGPDSINQMLDAYDTLTVLAGKGANIPPDVLLELAPLPVSVKKRLMDKFDNPMAQQKQQIEMQHGQAKVQEVQQSAFQKHAAGVKALHDAGQQDQGAPQQPPEHPGKVFSEIADKMASAEHKRSMAQKTRVEAQLEFPRFMAEQLHKRAALQKQNESKQGRS